MYRVSEAFRSALDSGAVQHIRGAIYVAGTDEVYRQLSEDDFIDAPQYSRQIVENPDTFNIGELYVGTVELAIVAKNDAEDRQMLGKELRLELGIEGIDEWVPLGRWDITEPQISSNRKLSLKGCDHLARLQCKTNNNIVAVITMQNVLDYISEITGVKFAQTAAEIKAMIGEEYAADPYLLFTLKFSETCWEEVRMIAQLIGGFAFANRFGEIEFKRLTKVDRVINADERFRAELANYYYGIASISYAESDSPYIERGTNQTNYNAMDAKGELSFSDNDFMPKYNGDEWSGGSGELAGAVLMSAVDGFVFNGNFGLWKSGTVEIYGDPTLDLGDVVTLAEGIVKENIFFPICSETWQFRAPQTLISAGAPSLSGAGSTSGGGSSGTSGATITVPPVTITRENKIISLETYTGELVVEDKKIAWGSFSTPKATACILSVSATLTASENGSVTFCISVDDDTLDYTPMQYVTAEQAVTVSFTLPLQLSAGTHKIIITATGSAEITGITAFGYGQELTDKVADYTDSNDYEYIIRDGTATITKYIGTKTQPEIPRLLDGVQTTVIGGGAFVDTDVAVVYIPDGVEEIQ